LIRSRQRISTATSRTTPSTAAMPSSVTMAMAKLDNMLCINISINIGGEQRCECCCDLLVLQ